MSHPSAQNNNPIRVPQRDLSFVTFSSTEFFGNEQGGYVAGRIAGTIIDSRFKDNVFSVDDDPVVSTSRFTTCVFVTIQDLT